MAKFCRHEKYKSITHIKEPRYHDESILIDTKLITEVEHYLFRFSKEAPAERYGWFYLKGGDIRHSPKQQNGRIECYAVKLNKREDFKPITDCVCENLELDLFK